MSVSLAEYKFTWKRRYPFGARSRFGVGGHAEHFLRATDEPQLKAAVRWCVRMQRPWHIVGSGTNVIVPDEGVTGYVIENDVNGFHYSRTRMFVRAGTPLNAVVNAANGAGFAGMESMADIPGTLGGAIVGNAGAYGQEMKDVVERVRAFDGRTVLTLTNRQCHFRYRASIFKHRPWVVLSAVLQFGLGNTDRLRAAAAKIRALRKEKFPASLRCPGSYFQNIVLRDVPVRIRKKLVAAFPEKIKASKLPSAVLLDAVGMRGKRSGGIRVASYHANLFLNDGRGTAADVHALAVWAKAAVKARFDVELHEEVRMLGEQH